MNKLFVSTMFGRDGTYGCYFLWIRLRWIVVIFYSKVEIFNVAIPNFYSLTFFTFMYFYLFALLTLLLFFIQRLKLKVNLLTFNLSPSKELHGISIKNYYLECQKKKPFYLLKSDLGLLWRVKKTLKTEIRKEKKTTY